MHTCPYSNPLDAHCLETTESLPGSQLSCDWHAPCLQATCSSACPTSQARHPLPSSSSTGTACQVRGFCDGLAPLPPQHSGPAAYGGRHSVQQPWPAQHQPPCHSCGFSSKSKPTAPLCTGWCAFVLVLLVAIFFAWAFQEPSEENEHLVKVRCNLPGCLLGWAASMHCRVPGMAQGKCVPLHAL